MADKVLGERVHPQTGRRIAYVACTRVFGVARVADEDELGDVAWASPDECARYVPDGFDPAVTQYLRSRCLT